jgi:hypothetical protein
MAMAAKRRFISLVWINIHENKDNVLGGQDIIKSPYFFSAGLNLPGDISLILIRDYNILRIINVKSCRIILFLYCLLQKKVLIFISSFCERK